MRKPDLTPPEAVAAKLTDLRALTRELERQYKALYIAAKHGGMSGGSIGKIGGKSKSDPTAAAALSPGERDFRKGVRAMSFKIDDATSDLEAARAKYERLMATMDGGIHDGKHIPRRTKFSYYGG